MLVPENPQMVKITLRDGARSRTTAIAWYVGSQGLESTYGAAASLVVLLIWVYYTAQIVLFGAEFTHVRAKQRDRQPPKSATSIGATDAAPQGRATAWR